LGIDQHRYGLVTAVYTVGGLAGSLISSRVVEREGIKGGLLWTGYINLFGVVCMTLATHWMMLAFGR
jgi:predicted MFS family arabinose efflux permease